MVPHRPCGHPRYRGALHARHAGGFGIVSNRSRAKGAVPVRGSWTLFPFCRRALFEEIGWRGFALPRLQRLYGPLVGSLVLGVLWALWHLPLFLIPSWDTPHGNVLDVALFVVLALALTIVLTWVFNNTKGSAVVVVVLTRGGLGYRNYLQEEARGSA